MNDDKIKALLNYGFQLEDFIKEIANGVPLVEVPGDLVDAVKLLTGASVAFSEAEAALAQYTNMTDEAALDVEKYVQDHYGVNPDNVEQVIEKVLSMVITLHTVVGFIASKIHKNAAPGTVVTPSAPVTPAT